MEQSCHPNADHQMLIGPNRPGRPDPSPLMATSTPHLELHLQQDVDQLRARVCEMGLKATRAVTRARDALLSGNTTEAEAVILRDRLIDQLEAEGERLGLELLVRHQPVGRTLRFVHASLRILRELERVGDCAESIARQTMTIAGLDPRPELPDYTEQLATALEMLDKALRADRGEDEALARATIPLEDAADQLRDRVSKELIAQQQEGQLGVHALTVLLTIARRLERITDLAKHLCEEVIFLATGHPVRHSHARDFSLLFVDETQSSLGHLAAAIARRQAGEDFAIHSAGLRPGPPDPRVRALLQREGIEPPILASHSLGQVPSPDEHHLIIGLTEGARIVFPMTSSRTLCLHWPMVDPTTLPDPAAAAAGLETAWRTLEQRLGPLLEAVRRD